MMPSPPARHPGARIFCRREATMARSVHLSKRKCVPKTGLRPELHGKGPHDRVTVSIATRLEKSERSIDSAETPRVMEPPPKGNWRPEDPFAVQLTMSGSPNLRPQIPEPGAPFVHPEQAVKSPIAPSNLRKRVYRSRRSATYRHIWHARRTVYRFGRYGHRWAKCRDQKLDRDKFRVVSVDVVDEDKASIQPIG